MSPDRKSRKEFRAFKRHVLKVMAVTPGIAAVGSDAMGGESTYRVKIFDAAGKTLDVKEIPGIQEIDSDGIWYDRKSGLMAR